MNDDVDDIVSALEGMTDAVADNASLVPPGRRPCPICGRHMQVDKFNGVPIDTCAEHGVWLDAGEMPAIVARARSGERIGRQQAIKRARRDGKISGTLLGAWSLLLD